MNIRIPLALVLAFACTSCSTMPGSSRERRADPAACTLRTLGIRDTPAEEAAFTLLARWGDAADARLPPFVWERSGPTNPVTLVASNITCRAAFEAIAKQSGRECAFLGNVLFAGSSNTCQRLRGLPAIRDIAPKDLRRRLDTDVESRIGSICGLALFDVVSDVSMAANIPTRVDPRIAGKVANGYAFVFDGFMPAGELLWWIAVLWDVDASVDGDTVEFKPRMGKAADAKR
jgi:hypothetical protein